LHLARINHTTVDVLPFLLHHNKAAADARD
jgi:hypothetical protein